MPGRAAALIDKIRAAASPDDLFLKLKEDLAALFDVEQLTLYAIDRENRELYSRFLLDPLPRHSGNPRPY